MRASKASRDPNGRSGRYCSAKPPSTSTASPSGAARTRAVSSAFGSGLATAARGAKRAMRSASAAAASRPSALSDH